MHFLFPTDPLNPRRIDDYFEPQRSAVRVLGHTASLLPDSVLSGAAPLKGVPPGTEVVYRGWMVTAEQYQTLVKAIETSGSRPLTSLSEYLATHHLPNWYPLVSAFTPLTRIFPEEADLVAELKHLAWPRFFIKDYVKSLKTSIGSVVTDPSQIIKVVEEMRRYRGEIEGGICVRQFEEFLPETERRYFVLRGRAFPSSPETAVPEVVATAAQLIPSPFFTVDVAQRTDLQLRIVELGDGQVSDLVGWPIESFSELWARVA